MTRALNLRWQALRLRCPICGGGSIFKSWFTPKEQCPTCGFVFSRGDSGYQLGAMALALIIPSLIWLASFVAILLTTWPNPPWTLLQWGSVAFMIVFPLAFYPVAHTLAMALDVLVRPPGRHH